MKTIKQIAEQLGVSKQSLEKRIKRNQLYTRIHPYIVKSENGTTYIDVEGENIIKTAYAYIPVYSSDEPVYSENEKSVYSSDEGVYSSDESVYSELSINEKSVYSSDESVYSELSINEKSVYSSDESVYSVYSETDNQARTANSSANETDNRQPVFFQCNIDTVGYKTKAQAKKETGGIVNRMKTQSQIKEIDAKKLSRLVTQGYSFTTAALNGTKEENFVSQRLAVIDIDNDRKDMPPTTVIDAAQTLEARGIAYSFFYYSFSHSDECPKFRIVCVLAKPITDPEQAKRLNQYLISLFPQSDQSCFNLDRFYYGTDKGLATKVYDWTTVIEVPQDWQPEQQTPDETIGLAEKEFKPKLNAGNGFDLTQAIRSFDLLAYIEQTTGTQGKRRGKDVLFNPCPVCGHKDDFYVDTEKNVYKCHSASNGTGGNIINYLEQTRNLDRKAAREYFIYDIMKQDRQEQKRAYKQKKREDSTKNQSPIDKKLLDRLVELQPQDKYYWNDLGSSRLFADVFRDRHRYNYTAKAWYIFDGNKWMEDVGSAKALEQFEKLYDSLLIYANTIEDSRKKTDYFEYILKLGKANQRKVILEDAENICAVYRDNFDKNNDLFNCQNGTLNLKTLEFNPHNSDDLLTKISNVHYDSSVKSPLFEKFINEVMKGDADKINYLQKALGYALTVDTHYETCFILYGATTRNGKSTLMSTIMHALGEHDGYSLDMKPETLALKKNVDSRQASGDIARLDGCRFLNASEPPKRMIFDVALLKNMLGRDPITARNIYEREFTFRPKFKLFINTNFLPLITDETLFKSGRINVVTFDRHFTPEEQDKTLKDRLTTQENISGIFNWCLEGLQKFRSEGLEPPQTVKDATAEYQRNSDKVGNFISECLEKSFNDNCKAGDVYDIYKKWCELNGYGCENKANFFDELKIKNIFANLGTVDGMSCKNIIRGYKIINDLTNDTPPMPVPPLNN